LDTYCCDINTPNDVKKEKVMPGDLINTPALTAHAQKFIKDSVFLALSTFKRSNNRYEDDTIAFQVIEGYINPELKLEKR
jgi:hypothetical protein